MSTIGHNSKPANDQLKSLVDRIERLEAETDIKDIYTEAKGNGFTPKILRKLVAFRKQDRAKREEEEALLEVYKEALGMLSELPLGRAALERAIT